MNYRTTVPPPSRSLLYMSLGSILIGPVCWMLLPVFAQRENERNHEITIVQGAPTLVSSDTREIVLNLQTRCTVSFEVSGSKFAFDGTFGAYRDLMDALQTGETARIRIVDGDVDTVHIGDKKLFSRDEHHRLLSKDALNPLMFLTFGAVICPLVGLFMLLGWLRQRDRHRKFIEYVTRHKPL